MHDDIPGLHAQNSIDSTLFVYSNYPFLFEKFVIDMHYKKNIRGGLSPAFLFHVVLLRELYP